MIRALLKQAVFEWNRTPGKPRHTECPPYGLLLGFLAVSACALIAPIPAWADDAGTDGDCAACTGDPEFPDAVDFLDAQGYPADDYSVLLAWHETSPVDAEQIVFGYHVRPKDASEPFDLYSDQEGHLLGTADLKALGIRRKNWNLRPKETSSEKTVRGTASSAAPKSIIEFVPNAETPAVTLPAVDLAAIELEDEAGVPGAGKGVTRIGVFQKLSTPVVASGASATLGSWQSKSTATREWSFIIESPEAIGIRVHFSARHLPTGASLILYNVNDTSERYDVSQQFKPGDSDIWSPTCFSDKVGIQCSVPEGTTEADVNIQVDRIVHMYRGLDTLSWAKADGAKSPAGACNLDVTCYPDYADTARGVGGMGAIGATGVLWCTGSLIVDTDSTTQIPYFLTAHHCLTSHSAGSVEVYWLYQTSECNGTAPSAASVPRTTGGADYLAGADSAFASGTGNDFALLRLKGTPPSGLTYLGWSTVTYPLETEVTCIHHPRGDYKRISFGTLTSTDNTYPTLFHGVHWHDGTTEPGSSGSPLMDTASQRIIGQLWGGLASCYSLDESDFYGRFDVTFPIVQSWLDTGPVPEVSFDPASCEVGESDGTVTVTVTLDELPGAAVSVHYSTSPATADENDDFVPAEGTLTFEGTQQTATFSVSIVNDTHAEETEYFTVVLSDPSECTLSSTYAPVQITITDNDTDTDDDGLSDYDEIHAVFGYVTDPNNPDTDGDTYTDYEEECRTYGLRTDPTVFTTLSGIAIPYFLDLLPTPLP